MGSPFTDVIQSITLEMLSNGDMHLCVSNRLEGTREGADQCSDDLMLRPAVFTAAALFPCPSLSVFSSLAVAALTSLALKESRAAVVVNQWMYVVFHRGSSQ